MSSEFELKRLNDKLRDLRQEQERLTYSLMHTRREEQLELDRVTREFRVRVQQLEIRQDGILQDIRHTERDLENKQRLAQKEAATDAAHQSKDPHRSGRSAYRHLS